MTLQNKRDKLGRLLPGQTANPGGRPKKLSHIIDAVAGENAVLCFEFLARVMKGEEISQRLARKISPNEDVFAAAQIPLIEEQAPMSVRVQAAELLIKYRHGSAPQTVNVNVDNTQDRRRIDAAKFDDAKLADLERLLESGEVVEGEFTAIFPEPKALPDGEP